MFYYFLATTLEIQWKALLSHLNFLWELWQATSFEMFSFKTSLTRGLVHTYESQMNPEVLGEVGRHGFHVLNLQGAIMLSFWNTWNVFCLSLSRLIQRWKPRHIRTHNHPNNASKCLDLRVFLFYFLSSLSLEWSIFLFFSIPKWKISFNVKTSVLLI